MSYSINAFIMASNNSTIAMVIISEVLREYITKLLMMINSNIATCIPIYMLLQQKSSLTVIYFIPDVLEEQY